MKLKELALAYFSARRSLIGEFSGHIQEDFIELAAEFEREINPLLIRHGLSPMEFNEDGDIKHGDRHVYENNANDEVRPRSERDEQSWPPRLCDLHWDRSGG